MACDRGLSRAPLAGLTCSTVRRLLPLMLYTLAWQKAQAWLAQCFDLPSAYTLQTHLAIQQADVIIMLLYCRRGLPCPDQAGLCDGQVLADAVRGQHQANQAEPWRCQDRQHQAAVHHVAFNCQHSEHLEG